MTIILCRQLLIYPPHPGMMGVRGENIKIFLAWLYSVAFFGEYLNKVSGLITIQPNNKNLHGMERDCFGNEK